MPIGSILKGTARGVFGLARSGPAGRAVVGAMAGGLAGGMQGYENPNLGFESMMKGAALGALGGAVISRAPRMALAGARAIARGTPFSATSMGRWGGIGKKMLGFTARHPIGTATVAAGLYGATQYNYSGMGTSPTMSGARVNTEYHRQAIAMDEMTMGGAAGLGMVGTAPQMMNRYHRTLQRSTEGLTQGLHRGRHG